ncbi:MAG: N-acetyltransferase family protein [Armatimonadia bacterium]
MDIRIREAREEDLPAILRIYNASIPERIATADTEPVTVESRREWFREHTTRRHPLWVAEIGGQVLGWASLSHFIHDRPAYAATAEISLYVAPECRHQGIGRRLTQAMIEYCPEVGIKTLVALIFGHNTPSLSLCKQLGFERWGFLPGIADLDGVSRDLVILGKKL